MNPCCIIVFNVSLPTTVKPHIYNHILSRNCFSLALNTEYSHTKLLISPTFYAIYTVWPTGKAVSAVRIRWAPDRALSNEDQSSELRRARTEPVWNCRYPDIILRIENVCFANESETDMFDPCGYFYKKSAGHFPGSADLQKKIWSWDWAVLRVHTVNSVRRRICSWYCWSNSIK